MGIGEISIGFDSTWREDIESWVRRIEASNAALREQVERLMAEVTAPADDRPSERVPVDAPLSCRVCACCVMLPSDGGNYMCADCRTVVSGWRDGEL